VHFGAKLGEKWHEKRENNRVSKKQVIKKAFYGAIWVFMT